ncbi:MAG: NADH-quinone oxidoreductase subunit A [Planctomycetota bacterium]
MSTALSGGICALHLGTFTAYLPLVFMAGIGITIGAVVLLLSKFLGPRRPDETKSLPYECGMEPLQDGARERYSIHFYLVAILFILFDLETVFLFPWATSFRQPGVDAAVKLVLLVEVLLFVGVLGVGLYYVWKRRGLEWD